jgi:glycosyltransferase involved in cell wall biosynthesis
MISLDRVTPLVLTCNEEANVARTLDALAWATRVVVLDSGSTDGTEQLARQYPNVAWYSRPFDCHAAQWRFGITSTAIEGDYILALDADQCVPPSFVDELTMRFLPGRFDVGVAAIDYRIEGRRLWRSLCPARPVIFRPERIGVTQAGHTQAFEPRGTIYRFRARLIHDDRKPIERFVASQTRYAALEAARIQSGHARRRLDRIRRLGIAPPLVAALAYLMAGGPMAGTAALRYAWERATFEVLLAEALGSARRRRRAPVPHEDPVVPLVDVGRVGAALRLPRQADMPYSRTRL